MNEILRHLLNLPQQASSIANDIDWLHYSVIVTTMIGATTVALLVLYFLIRYRARPDHADDSAPRELKRAVPKIVEVGVFGGLLSMFILWWLVGFHQYVTIAKPPADSIVVYVSAKQWMWSFAYPSGGATEGVLYVPVGRPVKLVMTSRDVIHSFYVPSFRLKQDVVPGRTTTLWFEVEKAGTYPVYCAEYCGVSHSTMHAEVVALADGDYSKRLAGLADSATSLAAQGEKIAGAVGCFRCHTPDGTPHIGPTFAGLYGARIPLEGGQVITADEAYLTRSMMDPAVQLHVGFKAVMPSYQGLLEPGQVGAIVEYIRSLRGTSRYEGALPLPRSVGDVPLVHPLEGAPAAGGASP